MAANPIQTGLRRLPAWASFLLRAVLPAVLVAVALVVQFADFPFRARIRDNAFDRLQALAPLPYRDELPVRVVAIDDASLGQVGQWPWPRTILARMTHQLADLGARVVVFDILLAEADRTSPEQAAAFWNTRPGVKALLAGMPAHDQVLAESFGRLKVGLGFPVEPGGNAAGLPEPKAGFLSFGGDANQWLPPYGGGVPNLPALAKAAAGSGAISLSPESDGVLRAMPLLYRVRDNLYPGLGLEALRLFLDIDQLGIQLAGEGGLARVPGILGVGFGPKEILPTAPDGRVWLHFRPYAAERYISARDLLDGKVDPRQVKDHIVFIGATAKGLGDAVFSPLGENIPGVEGHVQLVEQMLTGEYLLRPTWENDLVAGAFILTWLILGILLSRCRAYWSVLFAGAMVAGFFALSLWLFLNWRLLLDPFYPAVVTGILFLSMLVPRHLQVEWEQRWIREAFSRYVSPNRVKFLQEHPEELELGGNYRECSFVMTDLEGFTSFMEQRSPAQISGLINDYLDGMIRVAFSHDGTIDRIVGDALAVMFSAPLTQEDHAARALACALDMDRFTEKFRRRLGEAGIDFGRTRIGVNTGTVLVGNFGGQSLLDYRALGDPINTAARLEAINAQFGTRICVSEHTVAQCPAFVGRPVGQLVLKGKQSAVKAFEPLGAEADVAPVEDYLEAYGLMEAQSPEAGAAFRSLAERFPRDALVAYHVARLERGETGCLMVMGQK